MLTPAVLNRQRLRGCRPRKKALLQNGHVQARLKIQVQLKFAAAHMDTNSTSSAKKNGQISR